MLKFINTITHARVKKPKLCTAQIEPVYERKQTHKKEKDTNADKR